MIDPVELPRVGDEWTDPQGFLSTVEHVTWEEKQSATTSGLIVTTECAEDRLKAIREFIPTTVGRPQA